MRQVITTILDVVGVVAVVGGVWCFSAPAALIVFGIACVALSRVGSR